MLIELRTIENGPANPGAVIVHGYFPIDDDGSIDLSSVAFPADIDYLGIYADNRYAGIAHIGPDGIIPPTEEELQSRQSLWCKS